MDLFKERQDIKNRLSRIELKTDAIMHKLDCVLQKLSPQPRKFSYSNSEHETK